MPLPGRIVPGRLERLDTPLIPPDALREILVNALIHRDYSIAGGDMSLAIFDDRVEIWSAGRLPGGITPEVLTRKHSSIRRNPIIAEAFYRAGLIEKWGRGTNRVVAQCRQHGIAAPEFGEVGGSVAVTFKVMAGHTAQATAQVTEQVTAQVTEQVTEQVVALLESAHEPRSGAELQHALGLKHRPHFQTAYLGPLLRRGWLEMTIPDKPSSRLQRYRTTAAGLEALKQRRS